MLGIDGGARALDLGRLLEIIQMKDIDGFTQVGNSDGMEK